MRICGLYRANYGHFWEPTMEHDQLGQVRNENNWAKSTCRAKADSDATDNHRRVHPGGNRADQFRIEISIFGPIWIKARWRGACV